MVMLKLSRVIIKGHEDGFGVVLFSFGKISYGNCNWKIVFSSIELT